MSHSYSRRTQDQPSSYQCRHIFTEGRRCGGVCLRNEEFCYFHHTTRRPVEDAAARKARLGTFELIVPEDRAAIQLAICQVLERIASNDLDPRRAGLLLYGLQIASLNLPRPVAETTHMPFVEEVVHDETLGTLAPRATVEELEPISEATRILDELLEEGEFAACVPTIQAVGATKTPREPLTKLALQGTGFSPGGTGCCPRDISRRPSAIRETRLNVCRSLASHHLRRRSRG